MTFGDCERCGMSPFTTSKDTQPLKLIGDFKATLCNDCVNAWHNFLLSHEIWGRLKGNTDKTSFLQGQASAGTPPTEEAIQAISTERDELYKELFELGKAFVQDKAESR